MFFLNTRQFQHRTGPSARRRDIPAWTVNLCEIPERTGTTQVRRTRWDDIERALTRWVECGSGLEKRTLSRSCVPHIAKPVRKSRDTSLEHDAYRYCRWTVSRRRRVPKAPLSPRPTQCVGFETPRLLLLSNACAVLCEGERREESLFGARETPGSGASAARRGRRRGRRRLGRAAAAGRGGFPPPGDDV